MSKAATHLMFAGDAQAALNLYLSVFPGSTIDKMELYGANEAGIEGTVKRADATLLGHRLICIDSPVKHEFTFTPATSLFVDCDSEEQLDAAVEALRVEGKTYMAPANYGFSRKFAWVSDRYGVSWQINLP